MGLRGWIIGRVDQWLSEEADSERMVRMWEARGDDPCCHLPTDPYSVQPKGLKGYWVGRCDECRKPVLIKGDLPALL